MGPYELVHPEPLGKDVPQSFALSLYLFPERSGRAFGRSFSLGGRAWWKNSGGTEGFENRESRRWQAEQYTSLCDHPTASSKWVGKQLLSRARMGKQALAKQTAQALSVPPRVPLSLSAVVVVVYVLLQAPSQDSDLKSCFWAPPLLRINQLWNHPFCSFIYKGKISSSLRKSADQQKLSSLLTTAFCKHENDMFLPGRIFQTSLRESHLHVPSNLTSLKISGFSVLRGGGRNHQSFSYLWNIMHNYVKRKPSILGEKANSKTGTGKCTR